MLKNLLIFLITLFWFLIPSYSYAQTNDISTWTFMINVNNIAPGWSALIIEDSAEKTAQNVLQTIIDKFIIAFWVLALLVMTIGWGYMILYHGQDELLSKWKSIFSAGIIGLVVALSAGLLVRLVSYFLY